MRSFAAIFAAALVASAASAAGFQNGSFENGTFVDNTNAKTDSLAQNSSAITGWTVIGRGDVAWERSDNSYGITPEAGSYHLDLTGYTDSSPYGGMSQTFDTVAGHTYQLDFYVGASSAYTSGSSSVQASIGYDPANAARVALGTVVNGDVSSRSTWVSASSYLGAPLTFTATGASTVLDLVGQTGGAYIGLDKVSVADLTPNAPAAAPEPVSWATMLAGFGAVGGALRRRRRVHAVAG